MASRTCIYGRITTGTTTLATGRYMLNKVTVNSAGTTAGTLTLFDNTAGSGTVIATIQIPGAATQPAGFTLHYEAMFTTGLTAVLAGTTGADITITWG